MFKFIACIYVLLSLFSQVSNVDDVLAYHTDFLNNCLKDCMLTDLQLLKIVLKLMTDCVTFSNFMHVSLLVNCILFCLWEITVACNTLSTRNKIVEIVNRGRTG